MNMSCLWDLSHLTTFAVCHLRWHTMQWLNHFIWSVTSSCHYLPSTSILFPLFLWSSILKDLLRVWGGLVWGTEIFFSLVPPPSNGHHRSNDDCLEGERENYPVLCSIVCNSVHSAMHTHMNRSDSCLLVRFSFFVVVSYSLSVLDLAFWDYFVL